MITVSISVNGEPIFTRTVTNKVEEMGCYLSDDGTRIKHNPDDGVVALAIKALKAIKEVK